MARTVNARLTDDQWFHAMVTLLDRSRALREQHRQIEANPATSPARLLQLEAELRAVTGAMTALMDGSATAPDPIQQPTHEENAP